MKEKIVVILGDGMADYPDENGETALSLAKKPTADAMAKTATIGLCQTIPNGMSPGSDTANLSVLGYDPEIYYTGRSPLEAVSIGVKLGEDDVTYRANLVTLKDGIMADYSAGEISTDEARELITYAANNLNMPDWQLYAGVSYRHCLVHRGAKDVGAKLTPPHDISDKPFLPYLPSGKCAEELTQIMLRSQTLLKDHPINVARSKRGLNEATSLWMWGEGKKPALDSFFDKFALKGAMISAVDLLKGIAISAGMKSIDVDGATGTLSTNFSGKAAAAIDALNDCDYIYVHVEAPDECSHQGDRSGKIKAIEQIDCQIIKPIKQSLDAKKVRYKLMFLPDHLTPVKTRTHASDAVPFMIYDSSKPHNGAQSYDEFTALQSGCFVDKGCKLIEFLKDF